MTSRNALGKIGLILASIGAYLFFLFIVERLYQDFILLFQSTVRSILGQ